LKDVRLSGKEGPYAIVIKGFSGQYGVDGVTFERCTINGKPITGKSANVRLDSFAKNINFME
jgi:hypothetical protein